MPAPNIIKQRIETFEQNIPEYRSYKNETELRRQMEVEKRNLNLRKKNWKASWATI